MFVAFIDVITNSWEDVQTSGEILQHLNRTMKCEHCKKSFEIKCVKTLAFGTVEAQPRTGPRWTLKPRPHQQQRRTGFSWNFVLSTKSKLIEHFNLFWYCRTQKDEISFDVAKNGNNVEARFDFVERIVRLVAFNNVASTLLLVWTGLYSAPPLPSDGKGDSLPSSLLHKNCSPLWAIRVSSLGLLGFAFFPVMHMWTLHVDKAVGVAGLFLMRDCCRVR